MQFSLKKKVPKNTFDAHTGDPLGKMLYESYLQKFTIFVKFGDPTVWRGLLRAAISFGCQLFGFATLCLLGVASTSIAGFWGRLLICSGGGEVVPELVRNSLGILLWRIEAFLDRRSSCIVVNSHSMLTFPRANCLDCSRKIHRTDILWIASYNVLLPLNTGGAHGLPL